MPLVFTGLVRSRTRSTSARQGRFEKDHAACRLRRQAKLRPVMTALLFRDVPNRTGLAEPDRFETETEPNRLYREWNRIEPVLFWSRTGLNRIEPVLIGEKSDRVEPEHACSKERPKLRCKPRPGSRVKADQPLSSSNQAHDGPQLRTQETSGGVITAVGNEPLVALPPGCQPCGCQDRASPLAQCHATIANSPLSRVRRQVLRRTAG